MSLVSTYVRAVDGKLYRNPVIRGEGWFLCFDDDDPPELVVSKEVPKPHLSCFDETGKGFVCSRVFGGSAGSHLQAAHSYFGKLIEPIPIPTEHEGTVDDVVEIVQGVVYDPAEEQKK